ATHPFRPTKLLRNDVDSLQQRECRGDIRDRPLHQLALFQALEEFIQGTTEKKWDDFTVDLRKPASARAKRPAFAKASSFATLRRDKPAWLTG
ncbi:MAG: hypothetical protein DMF14_16875, partial [Verrucomicrobia bacterium]